MSEEINLKAIHQLQEYCQQANKKIGELNKQLKQTRADVIEEVREMISKQRFDMTGDSWNIREQLLKALTKLSEVEK